MNKKSKKWYRFTDEFIEFLDILIEDTFGSKSELANCMKVCVEAAGLKTSKACCMYDISYGGCPGDRLAVYKIAFKTLGYSGEMII